MSLIVLFRLYGVEDGRKELQQQQAKKLNKLTAIFHDWVALQNTCFLKVINSTTIILMFSVFIFIHFSVLISFSLTCFCDYVLVLFV